MHIWCGAFCVLQLNSSKIWQKGKYRISGLQKLLRDQNANVRYWRKADMSLRTADVRFLHRTCPLLAQSGHRLLHLKIRFRGYCGHVVLHGICLLFLPPDSTIHAFTVESSRLGMRDGAGFLWTIWAIKAFEPSFREHPIIDPICVVPILLLSYLLYCSQSLLPVRSKRHDQKNTTLSYWQLQNRPKCARNGRHETATENNR